MDTGFRSRGAVSSVCRPPALYPPVRNSAVTSYHERGLFCAKELISSASQVAPPSRHARADFGLCYPQFEPPAEDVNCWEF
jgi:hypothetical protein